ncbi:glutamate--tRNA ligase [Chelatococcus sp. SYSU_G07232]|uniref:Glutamate--tRNA ligase n=1 Tax=Chelatococcus albus TaxID=3047466 RepID=A0ABT7ABN5_9HYPH|nr:glutamate--tRNA ligase [Chelatococcus sp. SYSU_G07232]MDJ1156783.1 glutamate--tRNA ligase [Chelatococcus sp. SYSU_G07232]
MSDTVVTRFAPSPTGFLHIGGARTALFNWLYARRHGGKMLLRIEDTDRERSTEAAIKAILDGLSWLGLTWDGDVVYQYARAARHREVAEQLLRAGKAYYCYASQQELEEMREQARREGRPMRYDGRWRDRDPSEAPAGVKPVIRLKAPTDGETVIEDEVQGRVTWQNKDLDDLVLLRSDGTPTYMLAVVVDDHDMAVTHVIRGDDHLTNAARQKQIYDALGWDVPRFAHIPLIHGPDGAKLSKRHGALGVDAYRSMGYIPAALRNYLVRLGWSHGDQEIFSTEEMIAAFDLASVGRSPARFDFAKLENLNGHYMRLADDEDLIRAIEAILPELGPSRGLGTTFDPSLRRKLLAAMPGLKERAKTLVELLDSASYLYARRPLALDEKAKGLLGDDGRGRLAIVLPRLEAIADWSAETTEAAVRGVAEETGLKLGQLAQPLRAALTGRATSPGLFDVMAVLGRDESLSRLRDQLA